VETGVLVEEHGALSSRKRRRGNWFIAGPERRLQQQQRDADLAEEGGLGSGGSQALYRLAKIEAFL